MKVKMLTMTIMLGAIISLTMGCENESSNTTTPIPKTVATPAISPNGGDFPTGQLVTIMGTTPKSTIHYTLDGSDPSATSTLYTAPFPATVNMVVKAIGIKDDYNPSTITIATFKKENDTTPNPDYDKHPYLPIKLTEFVVTDKDSPFTEATDEDNKRARVITIEEKAHILETIDLMRFVINTPEFKTEFFLDDYRYKAAEDGNGIRTIKKGEYFDKNIIFNIIKNAAITTYLLKDDIAFSSNAAATKGPYFYVTVNAENPIVEGDTDNDPWTPRDLLIILPNSHTWTSSIYADKYYLAGLLFHELIHNLGFKHADFSYQDDLAVGVQDIFREVVNSKWKSKYKTELAEYTYYQTTYASFLTSDTVPIPE